MTFFDCETVGFHSPMVLFQYAIDNGPVQLWNIWYEPIDDTIDLFDAVLLCSEGIVGFNLAFDWFHVCQTYTTLLKLRDMVGGEALPINHVNEYVICEREARGPGNLCIKPKAACDLMLWARKNEYQVTMRRKPIRIRRVPYFIAQELADEVKHRLSALNKKNILNVDVKVMEPKGRSKSDPNGIRLADLEIQFKSSGSLKSLAANLLCGPGQPLEGKQVLVMGDVGVHKKFRPVEYGYDPVAQQGVLGWPLVLDEHVALWGFNQNARQYATDDVLYTRGIYEAFNRPKLGDTDSNLACMVGAVRWRGYALDLPAMNKLRDETFVRMDKAPRDPGTVRRYLSEVLDEFEISIIEESTKKTVLEELSKWKDHPVSSRASEVLDSRKAKFEKSIYDKFCKATRFHASFKVIGTLSSRMSGGDDLNAQGINRNPAVRKCFPLADDGLILCGGDFDSFEVGLGDAVFADPALRTFLLSKESPPIHSLFGSFIWPDLTIEQVTKSKKAEFPDIDYYTTAKSGLFATFLYGGNATTMKKKLEIDEVDGQRAIDEMYRRFPGAQLFVTRNFERFCSLKQEGGIGSIITYQEPEDYAETRMGDRRYFTLENAVIKILFDLAQKLPQEIKEKASQIKVMRNRPRDGEAGRTQSGDGACMTACFAAAFGLQGVVQRAGNNHYIQSYGARLAKELQAAIWAVQPAGATDWLVQPMNIHDEIMCPTHPTVVDTVAKIVNNKIAEFREFVPCIGMTWKTHMPTWADK